MNFPEEVLMAYADGELDAPLRTQVESAIAADPQIARRVAAHQALRGKLRAGFDPVLQEPVPERLAALLRNVPIETKTADVLTFRSKPAAPPPQRAWVRWGSLAASFALGAIVWHFATRLNSSAPITESHGELVAAGALAHALEQQLAANQTPADAVQMGVSFRSRQGRYCRTFRLHDTTAAAGLACRDRDAWLVQVLVHDATAVPNGQYRQAASALPPGVLGAVDEAIAGDPLDAAGEAQARAGGWRSKP